MEERDEDDRYAKSSSSLSLSSRLEKKNLVEDAVEDVE